MSRLTDKSSYCFVTCADDYKGTESIGENCKLYKACFERKMYDKLKHYEDLEEAGRLIEIDDSLPARDELDRCTHRHCNNCDKYRLELQLYKDNDKRIKGMTGMDMAEASARFTSYMKMKDEGRLIELPCKVGDTVYDVVLCVDNQYHIKEMVAKAVRPYGAIRWIKDKPPKLWNVYLDSDYEYAYRHFCDFGKTVFLTKAEAEAKLAELK